MLKIRLARFGRKKMPVYHVVVTDVRSPRDSNYIERIGIYNPTLSKNDNNRISIDKNRLMYWKSVGALYSPTVARLVSSDF